MDNCNPNNCPLEPRVEALERANEQHGKTHREIFKRMNEVEQENAVQEVHYKNIMEKLMALTTSHDTLNQKLSTLEAKPGKRWDGLVDKLIYAVALAVVVWISAGMPGLK